MSTATSLPGPHLDLVPVMARWWDRWLRGIDDGYDDEPALTWFAQRSTRPGPDRALVEGEWRSAPSWPLDGATVRTLPLGTGVVAYDVLADVGTAAWNSCAGSLPWGQPTDQRYDDAASLTFEWPADGLSLLGHPRLRLRLRSSQPVASVSAKLCDVFPDGTSSLVCRGFLNLTHRTSSTSPVAGAGGRVGRRGAGDGGDGVRRRPPGAPAAALAGRRRLAEHRRSPGAAVADVRPGPLRGGPADGRLVGASAAAAVRRSAHGRQCRRRRRRRGRRLARRP